MESNARKTWWEMEKAMSRNVDKGMQAAAASRPIEPLIGNESYTSVQRRTANSMWRLAESSVSDLLLGKDVRVTQMAAPGVNLQFLQTCPKCLCRVQGRYALFLVSVRMLGLPFVMRISYMT